MSAVQLSPELIWGLLPRFVGVLYFIAFASLIPQLEGVLGQRGNLPIAARMAAIRRDFPGARRFVEYPSVFWLSSSDLTVKLIPWVGALCGLCIVVGGALSPWALGLAWLLWLSLEPAVLIFPWDTMLQEVGFLTLFLPTQPVLPDIALSELPTPTIAFMFRWLVIRLMLGFGKVKFVGATKEDRLYLRGFFVWMPLPSPLAWFAHQLPQMALRFMLGFMFVAEVIAPVLGLFTGLPRLISFALLAALMLGIQATGNWGYFNIGYLLLCFCLLDVHASLLDWGHEPWASLAWQWPSVAVNALMLVMFLTGLFQLVVSNSWVGRTFMHLDLDRWVWNRPWVRALMSYFRAVAPLRIVNGYGVFQPNADAPVRVVPVFEGSDDGGATWRAYPYKFMPTRATDRPPVVAPYHPRFDMALYYTALGAFDGSFYGAYLGDGTPYSCWTRSTGLDRCAQRLLEGDPQVIATFGDNPFKEAPPGLVRVSAVAMSPTSSATRRATGAWWNVRRLGVLVPARGREPWVHKYAYPVPELFHPDWIHYKRRAPALRAIVDAYRRGMAPETAILQGSDLTDADVRAFFDEFVPAVNLERGNFALHQERADAIKAQFGVDGLVRNERILERFAWLLRQRTERHHFADAQPHIPIGSSFRYHMFLQELVMDGREAYLAYLEHPERVAARAERSSDALQLWTITMLRHDLVMHHVCVFRWISMLADSHKHGVPGIFEYIPLLTTLQPPDESFRPHVEKLPGGEYIVDGLYPPSDVQVVARAAG